MRACVAGCVIYTRERKETDDCEKTKYVGGIFVISSKVFKNYPLQREEERGRQRERENSVMCELEKGKWREARFARGHCTARAKSF